jgi:hypothetical protein
VKEKIKYMKNPGKRFVKHDWAFHDIPKAEQEMAWRWEIEREALGGTRAWLALTAKQRKEFIEYHKTTWPIKNLPLEYNGTTDDIQLRMNAYMNTAIEIHLLEIDWSASRSKIVAAFKEWVSNKDNWKSDVFYKRKVRKPEFAAWLEDLAIYRSHQKGIQREEAVQLMEDLFKKRLSMASSGKTSPEHWKKAINRTGEHVSEVKSRSFSLTKYFKSTWQAKSA